MSEGAPPGNVSKTRVGATRGFPLRGVVVEMRDQPNAQRVGGIQSLDDAQVTGNFCQALPEPQTPIVHGEGMRIKIA